MVNLVNQKCSCQRWCLSGFPCFHACASIFKNQEDPANYVHSLLSKETCLATYEPILMPIVGPIDWPKTELGDVIPLPKKEIKGIYQRNLFRDEFEKGGATMTRGGQAKTCNICNKLGHNKRSCSDRPYKEVNPPRKPRTKKNKGVKDQQSEQTTHQQPHKTNEQQLQQMNEKQPH
ncbi:hypothetical protein ACFE04_021440 [Oxalis oulophora]